MGRREIAEMIKCWGGDEGASLVAARLTTPLGHYTLHKCGRLHFTARGF
jgi:hypothetical protein